jgi:hypothetical protein
LRQNERTEKAEKLKTPPEEHDQIEPQIGIYIQVFSVINVYLTRKSIFIEEKKALL